MRCRLKVSMLGTASASTVGSAMFFDALTFLYKHKLFLFYQKYIVGWAGTAILLCPEIVADAAIIRSLSF